MNTGTLAATLLDELKIPARLEREQEWQNALRLVLPRLAPLKLIRQQAGQHRVMRASGKISPRVSDVDGGYIQCAPVGAADLSGWVVGHGLRVEVEAKYGDGRLRPAQRQWLATLAADGCIALVLTYDPAFVTQANLQVAHNSLRAALLARGVAA